MHNEMCAHGCDPWRHIDTYINITNCCNLHYLKDYEVVRIWDNDTTNSDIDVTMWIKA